MSRRRVSPRNEQSRRDRTLQHEIIRGMPRSHLARNDALATDRHIGNITPSIALTGTAIANGVLEAAIVTGSQTVIITLTDGKWAEDLGGDNSLTTDFLAAITGDDSGGNGFDDEVALVHGNLVRTSETVMTLTLPSAGSYAIAADETISVAPPASSLQQAIAPATLTFEVSIITVALTGTMVAGGVVESEIVTGSETLIITLTGDTWVATIGSDNAITTAFLAAITGDDPGSNGFDAEVTLVHGNLVRTSNTVLTLTLPSAGSYSVGVDEDITVAVPESAVTLGVSPATPAVVVITEGS